MSTTPTSTHRHASLVYRPDVDGLRAVAIITVLLFHAFPAVLPGGFIGVDVFFVISGFLITGILLDKERISISEFYVRRIKRIFPALAVVLCAVLLLGWGLLLPVEYRALGKYTLAGSLFSANVALWRDSGYFDVASDSKPLLHLWSLGVEEQYYFVWPLFVALLRRRRAFVPAIVVTAIASLLLCVWATLRSPCAAFYLPVTRYWELAAGGGVALLSRSRKSPWRYSEVAAWSGVLLLGAGLMLITGRSAFPGGWAILPVLGTAFIIGGGPGTTIARLLSQRTLVGVGLISYPLYLWHWPLLCFGRILAGDALQPVWRTGLCLLAVLLAAATYRFVEVSVRAGRARWTRPWILAGAVSLAGFAGVVVMASGGFPSRMHGPTALERPDASEASASCPPRLQGGGLDHLAYCRQVGRGARPESVVVGDSHAYSLFDGLAATGGTWLMLGNNSCPPLLGVRAEGEQKGCAEKYERILNYLKSPDAAAIHSVFVTFYSGYALDTAFAADHLQNHFGPDNYSIDGHRARVLKEPLLETGLEAYLVALLETGKAIYLVEDVPEFPFLPDRCATRPALRTSVRDLLAGGLPCSIDRESVQRRQSSYLAMTTRIASRHPGLHLFHMLDHACSSGTCPVLTPKGDLLYDDSHHLSLLGALMVAPAILRVAPRASAP